MSYIVEKGVKCHWNFKLLPKNFIAITLFGHVFFNISKKELEEYLKSPSGAITINHERIHIMQAKSFKTKYFGFYILYLAYWIRNLFTYGFGINAYYMIPFEQEAYSYEKDFNYNKTNWKEYKWK